MKADSDSRREFETAVVPHLPDLYRVALRLTGTRRDAEDLVQDTCLRALRALPQLRQPEAIRVWLLAILRSIFLRHVEQAAARPALVSLDDIDATRLRPDPLADELWARDRPGSLIGDIRDAILTLPHPYREALVLAHVAGLSYKELARVLDVPVGTVMSRLFRARRMLRACMNDLVRSRQRVGPAR